MDLRHIPDKGHVFAYGVDHSILFDSYETADGEIRFSSNGVFNEKDYCEYHFFCSAVEYRMVTVNGEQKEYCLSQEEETDDADLVTYREEQFLMDE